jgi:hypothetical protein
MRTLVLLTALMPVALSLAGCRAQECLKNADCPTELPICSEFTCVGCVNDFDCPDKDNVTYYCWKDPNNFGFCARCYWDENGSVVGCGGTKPLCWRDESDNGYDPFYNSYSNYLPTCVECIEDHDCPVAGNRCYSSGHTCAAP